MRGDSLPRGPAAMGLSLGDLFTAGLLFLNAIAVLHEERFLAKRRRPAPVFPDLAPRALPAACASQVVLFPALLTVPSRAHACSPTWQMAGAPTLPRSR